MLPVFPHEHTHQLCPIQSPSPQLLSLYSFSTPDHHVYKTSSTYLLLRVEIPMVPTSERVIAEAVTVSESEWRSGSIIMQQVVFEGIEVESNFSGRE